MKKFRISALFLLCSLLLSLNAHAVREVGNGGDAIVCRDATTGAIQQVLFYDYYEADNIRRIFPIGFPSVLPNFRDYLDVMTTRLARLNPRRAEVYAQWLKEFDQEADFLRDVELNDIPDTGGGWVPAGCHLEQLVVQREPRFRGEKRYAVNLDLFEKMSERDKAGMYFHEVTLREMINQAIPHTDSINTRMFHSMVASFKIENMSLKDYLGWLQQLRILSGETHNHIPIIVDKDLTFVDDQTVAKATGDMSVDQYELTWRNHVLSVKQNEKLAFNPQGYLKQWNFTQKYKLDIQSTPSVIEAEVENMRLGNSDRPIYLTGDVSVQTPGLRGHCAEVGIDEFGHVTSCMLPSEGSEVYFLGAWRTLDAPWGSIYSSDALTFDRQEFVVGGEINFKYIETSNYRGTCGKAKIVGRDRLESCNRGMGEMLIGGQWITVVDNHSGDSYIRPSLAFGPANQLITADVNLADVVSGLYKGSCTLVGLFPSGELKSCGEKNSIGSVYLFGAWRDHTGAVAYRTPSQLLSVSRVYGLDTPVLIGDVDFLFFDDLGNIAKVFARKGTQVKQTSPTQNNWLTCPYETCTAEFQVHSTVLLKTYNFSILSPLQVYNASAGYYPTGELKSFGGGRDCAARGTTAVGGDYNVWNIDDAQLSLDGKLVYFKGRLYSGGFVTGGGLQITKGLDLGFFPDETVAMMTLATSLDLPTPTGTQNYRTGQRVKFNSAGQVVDFCTVAESCTF